MCVCVTYVYLTLNIFHTINDTNCLNLPSPFAIPDICRLQCLHCYTLTASPHHVQVIALLFSLISTKSLLDLSTPGRGQRHHRPIRQIWLLPDARPFVVRAAKEQAFWTSLLLLTSSPAQSHTFQIIPASVCS